MTSGLECKNCSRPFTTPPQAADSKKFCCGSCRQAWHQEQRRLAMELLRQAQVREKQEDRQ